MVWTRSHIRNWFSTQVLNRRTCCSPGLLQSGPGFDKHRKLQKPWRGQDVSRFHTCGQICVDEGHVDTTISPDASPVGSPTVDVTAVCTACTNTGCICQGGRQQSHDSRDHLLMSAVSDCRTCSLGSGFGPGLALSRRSAGRVMQLL